MDAARWTIVLLDALSDGTVYVIDVVRERLGREPTSAELNAARRAAHGLAADGVAEVFRTRQVTAGGSTRQVLALTLSGGSPPASEPPARRGRPRSEIQVARTLVNAAVTAGRTAAQVDVGGIEPASAADLADQLRRAVTDLGQFEQQLRIRSDESVAGGAV